MDEQQRSALTSLLDEKVKERDELNSFIAVTSKMLGIPEPSGGQPAGEQGTQTLPLGALNGEPSAAVVEGEYFSFSAPKAARALLEKFGRSRPMKTEEIYAAITKGGVKIGSSGGLYRSLTRDKTFLRVGRGRWGLAEWYPESARRAAQADEDELEDADNNSGGGSAMPDEDSSSQTAAESG